MLREKPHQGPFPFPRGGASLWLFSTRFQPPALSAFRPGIQRLPIERKKLDLTGTALKECRPLWFLKTRSVSDIKLRVCFGLETRMESVVPRAAMDIYFLLHASLLLKLVWC